MISSTALTEILALPVWKRFKSWRLFGRICVIDLRIRKSRQT